MVIAQSLQQPDGFRSGQLCFSRVQKKVPQERDVNEFFDLLPRRGWALLVNTDWNLSRHFDIESLSY